MYKSTSSRRSRRIVCSLLGIAIFSLTAITLVYAGERIKVTLRSFFDVRSFYGNFEYSPIVETGIPASKHILVIKNCRCLDDATDDRGNAYYFYMVDHSKGLKSLITATELDPIEELDQQTKEFVEIVKQEMRKDGGLEALIQKFENQNERQVSIPSFPSPSSHHVYFSFLSIPR